MHKENSPLIAVKFAGFDVVMTDVPSDILKKLNDRTDAIQQTWDAPSMGTRTVGHIRKQYQLEDTGDLDNFILKLSNAYCQFLSERGQLQNMCVDHFNLLCGSPWINFQAPTEYNPLHNHGGLLSWVIWLRIPFDIEKEQEYFPNINKQVLNGSFEFVYPSVAGVSTHVMDVNKTYEGRILIFPSTLKHQVYPFYTTEEYRISISGNVFIDNRTTENMKIINQY